MKQPRWLRSLFRAVEMIAGSIAFAIALLILYWLFLALKWSFGLLLWAAGTAIVGLLLLGIALHAGEPRQLASSRKRLLMRMGGHAARSFAAASFAVAIGLVAAAVFQGIVLDSVGDITVATISSIEDWSLSVKIWLDRALGLDVLAGVLLICVLLSVLVPVKSLVTRALFWRRAVAFAYIVLLTLTSFTFFAGRALRPYELRRRAHFRQELADALERQQCDSRKLLVAMAWIQAKLETPSAAPSREETARLRALLLRWPGGDLSTAAWRIAGFDAAMMLSEARERRQARHLDEADELAWLIAGSESYTPVAETVATWVRRTTGSLVGSLRSVDQVQASHYLQLIREVQPHGWRSDPAPYHEARLAARELLANALSARIGGAVEEGALRVFIGELADAVAAPLWDVVFPLDIRDMPSAGAFVSAQHLDRGPLDWSRIPDPPPPPDQPVTAYGGGAVTGASTPSSRMNLQIGLQRSWERFDSRTTFVVKPPALTPKVYRGVRIR